MGKPRASSTLLRQIRVRPRLASSTGLGLVASIVLPRSLSGLSRALVAWDVGAGLYLILALTLMLRSTVEGIRGRARQHDEGAAVVLGFTVVATMASLAAIVLQLVGVQSSPPREQTAHLVLAGVTILFSWCFVHTAFALHYAHEFYIDRDQAASPGLQFPGGGPPDYLDFLYFSFVIGTTSQTADVAIASRSLRRLALLHGVIAFLFNTTLVALAVNIAAGLI